MSQNPYGSDALDELASSPLGNPSAAAPYTPEEMSQYLDGELTLGQLHKLTEDDAYQIAEVGYAQFQQGQYTEAFKIFAGLQSANPFDPYFTLMLASIFAKTGNQTAAAHGYAAVLELDPENVGALTSLAELQLNNGLFAEALENLGQVAKLDPEAKTPTAIRARALAVGAQRFLQAIVDLPKAQA